MWAALLRLLGRIQARFLKNPHDQRHAGRFTDGPHRPPLVVRPVRMPLHRLPGEPDRNFAFRLRCAGWTYAMIAHQIGCTVEQARRWDTNADGDESDGKGSG